MRKILFTREISSFPLHEFPNSEFRFQPLIHKVSLPLSSSDRKEIENTKNWIISSGNTYKILGNKNIRSSSSVNLWAVGEVDQSIQWGGVRKFDYSKDLVEALEESKEESFAFLGAKQPLPSFQENLKSTKKGVKFFALYETKPLSIQFVQNFHAIVFFSPSAVKSYLSQNQAKSEKIYCIGKTTGRFCQKFWKDVSWPEKPNRKALIELLKQDLS